jgi:hypothetical protein
VFKIDDHLLPRRIEVFISITIIGEPHTVSSARGEEDARCSRL